MLMVFLEPLMQTFESRVSEKMTMLKAIVSDLEKLLQETEDAAVKDEMVREIQHLTEGVVGMRGAQPPKDTSDPEHNEGTDSQHEEEFWANPDNIRVVEDVERAALQRTEGNEMPSFSLGFTQMHTVDTNAPATNEVEPQGCTETHLGMETDHECAPEAVEYAAPGTETIGTPAEVIIGNVSSNSYPHLLYHFANISSSW